MKAKLTSQEKNERLALQELIPLKTPLVVYVESSGYCNLRCAFCPHGMDAKALKKDIMSAELFEKLIGDLAAFPEKIKLIRFTGEGDPLVNKNIIKMLKYAKERKVAERIELISNGTLLSADLIENLPRFLDRIIFSIEGLSAEEYLRICNTNIDFQRLLGNLKAIFDAKGDCTVHIKIHNEAVNSEEKKALFFKTFSNLCDEIYIEQLVPMWPELISEYAVDKFRWGGDMVKRKVCPQIFKAVQVQGNGDVVPCCVDWRRMHLLGNVGRASLLEIWNGAKLRGLQVQHLKGNKNKIEPCKDCAFNDYNEIDNIDQYSEECLKRLQ